MTPEQSPSADGETALLRRGADAARVDDRGQTALGVAVFRDLPETPRLPGTPHLLGARPGA